jgi:hypothetical protein
MSQNEWIYSMAMPLLPQQPAPVTRREAALTACFLLPAVDALTELFQALRAETDRELGPSLGSKYGKPYPLSCCRQITQDVLSRLGTALAKPDHRGARALHAFLAAGGSGRCVWGALRGQYFQTALQFGGLYVDVANDTVTVTKPKVEILPMEKAGLEAVRRAEHFAEIATKYWGIQVFANHALPTLAPLLPMIGVVPGQPPVLHSATDYMIELFCQDNFVRSEMWLSQGPMPPAEVVEELRKRCPDDVLTANPCANAEAAIAACRSARVQKLATNAEWRDSCVKDFLRVHPAAPTVPAARPLAKALNIVWRTDNGARQGWRHSEQTRKKRMQ